MISVVRIMIALIYIFAGRVTGKNDCRACLGYQRVYFDYYVSEEVASTFWKASTGPCMTGNDFNLLGTQTEECMQICTQKVGDRCVKMENGCKSWNFNLKIWRYCGNGGSVKLTKGKHCAGGICADQDTLTLTCNPSVDCHGDCNCRQCGC